MRSLEDYIAEMETRSAMQQNQTSAEDPWTQLQQKDNDLVLAAELGQALLKDNQQLKKTLDSTVEDYCKKLETAEQEKHILKRKMASIESESEACILELQNDVSELTNKLTSKEAVIKQWERDNNKLVSELNAQNSRLTGQLTEASQLETQLRLEIQDLREQCSVSKKSLAEHVNSVDGLRDELNLVTKKKEELERRLMVVAGERDNVTTALEDASDRILLLERHAREQELRYQQSLKDYSLPHEKLSIEERLAGNGTDFRSSDHRSLLAEMDVSEPTVSQECMSVYRQLRSLCQQLKTHNDDDSGLHSDCSTGSLDESQQLTAGLLNETAQELVALVLDTDAVRLLERLDRTRRDIQERDAEISRRGETIRELTSKLSECDAELTATLEERDRARQDASSSSLAQDDAVIKAREVRDQAVTRKNKVEVELARTRVDLMQANGQLLEAIQQKVELSQQLEQWQMDMQELLDEQLRNKLNSQEEKMREEAQHSTPIAPPRRKLLLRFFQR